jgi:Helix-turn-helix domain
MTSFETQTGLGGELRGMRALVAIPDFLTVEEAAAVLRIGRSAAYALAREYLGADGVSGLPVVRFGRLLRVPRVRLEAMIGGPITWPPIAASPTPTPAPSPSPIPIARSRSSRARRSVVPAPMLPFGRSLS